MTSWSLVPWREAAHGQARLGAGRLQLGRRALRDRRRLVDDPAEHQLDDPVLRALGHVDDADRLALAQHGRPVADGGDLDHPVGDEDDRPVAALLAADDRQDPFGEVRGQRRRHLVEHEHVGLDRERAGEVDDPERGQRHAPRHARQIQVLQAELGEPVPERLDGRPGQAQVRPDVEVGDERRFLVDRDEAAPAGLARGVDGALVAVHGDRAAIGPDGAGQDLDEGALAGAVGAHERMDLARAHGERRGLERDDRAVRLRDAGRLEQQVRGGDRHRSLSGVWRRSPAEPATSMWTGGCYAPLQLAGTVFGSYVVQSLMDRLSGHSGSIPGTDCHALQLGLARVGQVVDQDRIEQDRVRLARAGRGRDRLAVEELEGERDAGTTDRGGVGHGRALEARELDRVEELGDEATDVGVGDRHERLLGRALIASTICLPMPDAQIPWILSY